MDSRFFGASREIFHKYFTGMGAEIEEEQGVFFEHVAARRMLSSLAAGHAFRCFETLPRIIGRSASLDASYDGRGVRLKGLLRERVRHTMIDREILI
jgi:hypothetical protein